MGSRDSVDYYSGLVLHRHITEWLEGVGYELEIGTGSGKRSTVSWRVASAESVGSVLSITIRPHNLQRIPLALRWAPHYAYLRPMLKSYLSSVLRGFDWYITTGVPVARNQFGSHRWFSPQKKGKAAGSER